MRAVLHQDIVALARCLLVLPTSERGRAARHMVALTSRADCFRMQEGRVHPLYGNGTLSSCCQSAPKAAERRLDDPDYGECLIRALEAVLAFRAGTVASG